LTCSYHSGPREIGWIVLFAGINKQRCRMANSQDEQ
jgi:hypothetical protein